jgi:hypothetical protein
MDTIHLSSMRAENSIANAPSMVGAGRTTDEGEVK